MDRYGLLFDHLGLAVRKPEKALRFIEGLGYKAGDPVYDPLQKVNLIWCSAPAMPAIELIYPSESEEESPVDNILSDKNEMIYHLCYRSADTQKSIQAIKNDGVRVICACEEKPAILFGQKMVSFYMVHGFGLIEIIEE